jgi:uncharacterized protein (TIGR03000 family)
MSSVLKVVAVVTGVVALAACLGVRPAQAKDYPNGYDPASGWSWDEDFRYNPATNPFGLRGADWDAWQGYTPSYRVYVPYNPAPVGYYYGSLPYGRMPPADYSYGAYSRPAPDNLARVRVIVPADAKVWFDDKATRQDGTDRRFESPALTPGRAYTYDVKARWRDKDGKEVTRTRRVDVSANANVTVDFLRE